MDLKLDDNVVYAILGAVVLIFFIVYVTRIVRIRASMKYEQVQYPYDVEAPATTATWPAVKPTE